MVNGPRRHSDGNRSENLAAKLGFCEGKTHMSLGDGHGETLEDGDRLGRTDCKSYEIEREMEMGILIMR